MKTVLQTVIFNIFHIILFKNLFKCLTDLEKCVSFFNAMYSVLLAGESLVNETQIVRDCTAAISSACDSIGTDSAIIRALIMVIIIFHLKLV